MTAATDDAARAYVWGYPLVAVHRTRAATAGEGMVARTRLSTPADRSVVAPNNDTLYSSGWYDLAAGDLVVDVGPMDGPGRYWSVMLVDAHTHVTYVSRRHHGTGGTSVRVVLDAGAPPVDEARPVVPVATRTVWVLARVLVAGPHDLPAARAAQAAIRVRQEGSARPGPPMGRGDDAFFEDLRRALAVDPPAPRHPPAPAGLDDLLASAPPGVLRAGAAEGARRIAAHGSGADRVGNGWGTRSRGADHGRDVLHRAAFARTSLAGHLPVENRSYLRLLDGAGTRRLRFSPGGLPPVDGFWSLTLYGPDLFLVDNDLGRHSLGDRTPGLVPDPDGGLTVLVGSDRPDDVARWLPAPAGPCVLVLRAYEGRPEVVEATWFPPPLVPVGGAESDPQTSNDLH